MDFRIKGLSPQPFAPLFSLSHEELAGRGVKRIVVDEPNAVPCRVSLVEAIPGEEVLLLPHQNVEGPSPYQSVGPIYVRKSARVAAHLEDRIPEMQLRRLSAVRAYDENGWLLESDVVPGADLEARVRRMLADPTVSFLNVHNARPGCFAFRVDRVAPSGL